MLKNPIPHLKEASDAATKIAFLQRDLYVLNAELKAMAQAKRIAYGVIGLIFLNIMLTLGLFWVTQLLHELGWTAGVLAVASICVFGVLSGVSFLLAYRTNHRAEGSTP